MKKGKSLFQEHGRLAIPIMQGTMQGRAEELYKIPERFQVTTNDGPSVTITDTETGKSVSVGLCNYHGARIVLGTFF